MSTFRQNIGKYLEARRFKGEKVGGIYEIYGRY